MNAQEVWLQALAYLKNQFSRSDYETWIQGVAIVGVEDGVLLIGAPTPYARQWLERQAGDTIQKILSGILGYPIQIRIVIAKSGEKPPIPTPREKGAPASPQPGPDSEIRIELDHRTQDSYELLPELIWETVAQGIAQLSDPVLYLYLRYLWRERHWNPQAIAESEVKPLLLRRPLLGELFGVQSQTIRLATDRLANVLTAAGNPLLEASTPPGGGKKTQTHYQLYSFRQQGRLLAKTDRAEIGCTVPYDRVHHGLFLPFGAIRNEAVTRYIAQGPALSRHGAGLYLYLLCLANQQRHSDCGSSASWDKPPLALTRRELETRLRINLHKHQDDLEALEELGWVCREATSRESSTYLISEAPASLLELVVLARVRQRQLPAARTNTYLDDIEAGMLGREWVEQQLAQLRWTLTAQGQGLLETEIARLAPQG